MTTDLPQLGAIPIDDRQTRFTVWAPTAATLALYFPASKKREPMVCNDAGYHTLTTTAPAGTLFQYQFEDGRLRPDPASRAQPEGVHGPSMVVGMGKSSHSAPFLNPTLASHIIYELHIGTFTKEGTFESAIAQLDDLRTLGITAVELMPIAQFPGSRNWGYDGVNMLAAQASYGGIDGLRKLVDACHARNIAVIIDVVYNHLGPEGNYLGDFGPYFTDRYKTPWGSALNFDGPESDHVRELFIQSALHWTVECGCDGLRLDAIHAIIDHTARTFVEELTARVHAAAAKAGRRVLVIAESGDNDPKLVRPEAAGGLGLDGCWNDDFHHAVRCAITGETGGYYKPYGSVTQITKALRDRYVFAGEYSSGHKRRHGAPAQDIPHHHLVVFTQNHDQVGNRPHGDRLDVAAGADGARLAAAMMLLSPFSPMLWMGEEYGEEAPFLYFVSHSEPALIDAVRKGRAAEFAEFFKGTDAPDPQSEATFASSKLRWPNRGTPSGAARLAFYKTLLSLRNSLEVPGLADTIDPITWDDHRCIGFTYGEPHSAFVAANFGDARASLTIPASRLASSNAWRIVLDSNAPAWRGSAEPDHTLSTFTQSGQVFSMCLSPRSALVLAAEPTHS